MGRIISSLLVDDAQACATDWVADSVRVTSNDSLMSAQGEHPGSAEGAGLYPGYR